MFENKARGSGSLVGKKTHFMHTLIPRVEKEVVEEGREVLFIVNKIFNEGEAILERKVEKFLRLILFFFKSAAQTHFPDARTQGRQDHAIITEKKEEVSPRHRLFKGLQQPILSFARQRLWDDKEDFACTEGLTRGKNGEGTRRVNSKRLFSQNEKVGRPLQGFSRSFKESVKLGFGALPVANDKVGVMEMREVEIHAWRYCADFSTFTSSTSKMSVELAGIVPTA